MTGGLPDWLSAERLQTGGGGLDVNEHLCKVEPNLSALLEGGCVQDLDGDTTAELLLLTPGMTLVCCSALSPLLDPKYFYGKQLLFIPPSCVFILWLSW